MNDKIRKLKEVEIEARKARIQAEEEWRINELKPLLMKQVGKCFKFKNSYGSGSDYPDWWLYVKIFRLNEDGTFAVERFQNKPDGQIEIEYRNEYNYDKSTFDDSWIEIEYEEYIQARDEVIELLKSKGFI